MGYSTLKAALDAVVRTNGQQQITGANLNGVMTTLLKGVDILDRANPADTSGMSYLVLDKGKTFAEQVIGSKIIYEIRDEFNLGSSSVNIPAGCVLKFNGGKIVGGTLVGNHTMIIADNEFVISSSLSGTFDGISLPEWFGAVGDGATDDSSAIQKAIDNFGLISFSRKVYAINNSIRVVGASYLFPSGGAESFMGKYIVGNKAKIVVLSDIPGVVVTGYGSRIDSLFLTYKAGISYNSALLQLESLSANSVHQCCYNNFYDIKCVSSENVAGGTGYKGIGIKLTSDGAYATYNNHFEGCFIADLHYGILIDGNSSAGINVNEFICDISNCDWLVYGNPGGSVFVGSWQAGFAVSGQNNACIYLTGSNNLFDVFVYDVGEWSPNRTMSPFLYVLGKNNVFTQTPAFACVRGDIMHNKISFSRTPAYCDNRIASNVRSAIRGIGGEPVQVIPADNSLRNTGVSIGLVTQNVGYVYASATLYPTRDANNIPTDIKALSGKVDGRSFELSVTNSKIKIQITLPANTFLDYLYLYFTNRLAFPSSVKLNEYATGFDGNLYYTETLDISSWAAYCVRSINFAPYYTESTQPRYIEIEMDFNYESATNIGFAYISGIASNKSYGLLLDNS